MCSRNKKRKKKKRTEFQELLGKELRTKWKIFMLQYKCMAHLNIASLLPHFRKDVGEGEKIQEMLTKDVECLPYGKQHLGIFNLLSEQEENKGLSTLQWHGESK